MNNDDKRNQEKNFILFAFLLFFFRSRFPDRFGSHLLSWWRVLHTQSYAVIYEETEKGGKEKLEREKGKGK